VAPCECNAGTNADDYVCARPLTEAGAQGTRDAPRRVMRFLKRLMIIGALMGIGSCYVNTSPRYAYSRYCPYGWFWNGYRCQHY